jgi:hypothetical protein
MPPSQVASLLEKAGIEAKRRAETLSLEEWRELWEIFAPCLCHPERNEGSPRFFGRHAPSE